MKKSNGDNKRRLKRNHQVRPQAQQRAENGTSSFLLRESKAKPRAPTQPPFPGGLKTQTDGLEQIRKRWEHKQDELEIRWATAQALQAGKDARRKRTIKICSSIASTGVVVLFCIVAWFAA